MRAWEEVVYTGTRSPIFISVALGVGICVFMSILGEVGDCSKYIWAYRDTISGWMGGWVDTRAVEGHEDERIIFMIR
jgi:hypothetical protein